MTRFEREKHTVAMMVALYCRRREGNKELCGQCRELIDYACARLDRCPHGERKPSCRSCAIHCYSPSMRERMRKVMRFSGPRMLFYSPLEALRHLIR